MGRSKTRQNCPNYPPDGDKSRAWRKNSRKNEEKDSPRSMPNGNIHFCKYVQISLSETNIWLFLVPGKWKENVKTGRTSYRNIDKDSRQMAHSVQDLILYLKEERNFTELSEKRSTLDVQTVMAKVSRNQNWTQG